MIKKSVFEKDLIDGMQCELRKIASQETPNLSKAGECLHSALEIFEDLGLTKNANQVLQLLSKIAATHHAKKQMPTLPQLLQVGLKPEDIKGLQEGNVSSKYRMNIALRNLGFDEKQIAEYIGHKNIIPVADLEGYKKMVQMMQNPTAPDPIPESVSYTSLAPDMESVPNITPWKPETLEFKSVGARSRSQHPHRPDTIHPELSHDHHTKGLTPQKMVENLKHHGIVFNMADDGLDVSNADFDPEFAEALGVNSADDLDNLDVNDLFNAISVDADDIGYQDITDAEDNLEISDNEMIDFEDEVSIPKK